MSEPILTQVAEGHPVEVKSRYGDARTVKVDREWKVEIEGREIGRIRYGMITRERRGQGMRYVSARWQSPGWQRQEAGAHCWFECTSKKAGIESLVWNDARQE